MGFLASVAQAFGREKHPIEPFSSGVSKKLMQTLSEHNSSDYSRFTKNGPIIFLAFVDKDKKTIFENPVENLDPFSFYATKTTRLDGFKLTFKGLDGKVESSHLTKPTSPIHLFNGDSISFSWDCLLTM